MTLVEQGVDSLVAVEVRSWSLKELGLDMPVLKILGGASMLSIIEEAMVEISPAMIPSLKLTNEPASTPTVLNSTGEPQGDESLLEKSTQDSSSAQEALGDDGQSVQLIQYDDARRDSQDQSLQTKQHSDASSSPMSFPQQSRNSGSDTSTDLTDSETLTKHHMQDIPKEHVEKMSFGQSRFWFLNQFIRDKTTFNMAFSARLEGHLRLAELKAAVRVVGQKHEALRTRFFSSGDHMDQPMQGILDTSLIRLKHKTISNESQATQELQDMRDHVWDLEQWESMRITVLSLSDTSHYLLVACHHIAMDGISFQILLSDLDKVYNGQELAPCLPTSQYRAFAAGQHQDFAAGKMETDFDFYSRLIPKDPKPIPLFPFARSSSRKILDNYGAHRANVRLDPALTTRIKAQARKNKATTFHFYLAALQCLVFRLLDNTDEFYIGIADANRTDSKYMGTLGFLLNLLPLYFQRATNQPFGKAVQDARNKAYAALSHSKVPFDLLLNRLNITRSATYTPLFQIFFDYRQGVQERSTFAGCKAEGEHWYLAKTGYDLGLDIIDNAAGDSLITLRLQDSLYSENDTKALLRSYVNLLDTFSTSPDMSLEQVQIWRKEDTDSAIALGQGQYDGSVYLGSDADYV